MQKRLSVYGNSLALTIERPLLRMLGIARNTMLRITTDGRRLIVEPLVNDPVVPVLSPKGRSKVMLSQKIDAREMARSLVHDFSMGHERFGVLHHDGASSMREVFSFLGWVTSSDLSKIDDAERATLQRLWECYRTLRGRGTWDDAIQKALAKFPKAPAMT